MYGYGEQEVGVASGSGWNLWVWLLGVVLRRYRFPHTTYPYSSCIYLYFFAAASLLFCSFFLMFFVLCNTLRIVLCIIIFIMYHIMCCIMTLYCFINK